MSATSSPSVPSSVSSAPAQRTSTTLSGTHLPLPSPMPAISHVPQRPPSSSSTTSSVDHAHDPTAPFFGYTFGSAAATHESRHDRPVSEMLPAYVEESDCPAYAVTAPEPVTLAMYLFKFGFIFPPFWIIGAYILLSPLREPSVESAWLPDKTQAERQKIIDDMRRAEVKWAKRCLAALFVAFAIALTVGLVGHAYIRH